MVEREQLRVSDHERQVAVDRLRLAHDEGRLDLDEYDRRLAAAYSSKTYGDLDQLFLDLPAPGTVPVVHRAAVPAQRKAAAVAVADGAFARMPLALKVLWTIYGSAVAINLMVWFLVSVSTGVTYFWPMWLLIPGAALGTVTASMDAHRRGR
ncbi:MAG: hypothetical protein JWR45_1235 [Blastococcus sp.]|nr:hypothetical protein [Blastococcus sp.]